MHPTDRSFDIGTSSEERLDTTGAKSAWTTPRVERLGALPVEGATTPSPTESPFGIYGPIS